MLLPLTVSCFSKIQIGFTCLVPAHGPGSPGKRADPTNGNKNTWIRENTIRVLLNSITYNFCVISYRTQRKICKVVTKNITAFIYMVTLTVITWKLSDNSGQCANLYTSKLHTYIFSSIHTVTVTFGSNKVCDTWQKTSKTIILTFLTPLSRR